MSATDIAGVLAWEALDSRGNPTVGAEVRLAGGARGQAVVPSGASTGRYEAHELRDGGERYGGRGVARAVRNVEEVLAPAVAGQDAADQRGLDRLLEETDGTEGLARLGANAVLAVSMAAALAAAAANGVPLYRWLGPKGEPEPLLPMPMVNILSGGAHAGGAIDMQDFLVVPVGASCFAEAIEWAWRCRRAVSEMALQRGLPGAQLAADEGGLGLALGSNVAALELLVAGIERTGLVPGEQVAVAIDVAANQLSAGGRYHLRSEGRTLSGAELVGELESWAAKWPLVSVEDPLADEDWEGWREAGARLCPLAQVIGDDLFATNPARLRRGIDERVANAVLVKPNQIGTLSRAAEVVEAARAAGWATVVSGRSGDTEDSWLADLAVAWRSGQVKIGSTTRSERNSKWNRLLRIEAEPPSRLAGRSTLGGPRKGRWP